MPTWYSHYWELHPVLRMGYMFGATLKGRRDVPVYSVLHGVLAQSREVRRRVGRRKELTIGLLREADNQVATPMVGQSDDRLG